MDRQDESGLPPAASTAVAELIGRLRRDGLFSGGDVEAVLRGALAGVAPAVSASLSGRRGFADGAYEGLSGAD